MNSLFRSAVILSFSLYFAGCFLDFGRTCSLTITTDYSGSLRNSRTAVPAVSMEISRIRLSGTGPDGKTFESSSTGGSVIIGSISPGVWKFSADGFNASNTAVGHGESSIELIPYQENICSITLRPLDGKGSISISVNWEAGAVYNPSLSGTVSGNGTESAALSLAPSGNGAMTELTDLNDGYYLVTVQIYDGTIHIGGFSEAARVVSGLKTEISFSLSTEISELTCITDLLYEMNDPVVLSLGSPAYPIVRGDMIRFTCGMPQDLSGTSVLWFLNGLPLDSRDSSILLDTASMIRNNRIDSVVFSPGGKTGGSIMRGFIVEDELAVGNLSYRMSISDGMSSVDGFGGARDVAISPDGTRIFVAGYEDNAVVELHADSESPAVSFVRCTRKSGSLLLGGTTALSMSSDGTALFAASSGDGALTVFSPDTAAGGFVPVFSCTSVDAACLAGVSDVAVSPDCRHVYSVSPDGKAGVFGYDPAGKTLSFLSRIVSDDVQNGAAFTPRSIAVSPDGSLVAIGCYAGDGVFLFTRDSESGGLQLMQVILNGMDGVSTLNGVEGLRFSSDSRDLFVCSYYDNALVTFRFDAGALRMNLHEEWKNGVNGIHGLKYAKDVDLSSDGSTVYVTGSGDDALAAFSRNVDTGDLSFTGCFINGEKRLTTLDSPRGIAVSGTGRVLVAAAAPGSLNVFNRRE